MNTKGSLWLVRLVLAAGCLLLPAAAGWAQEIGGQVTDATNAVLPGVTVEIRNLDTGITRTAVTDELGHYRAAALTLGNYAVEASLSGFQKFTRSGIALTLGRDATVNIQLQVGGLTEGVTVVGDAPIVEVRRAEVTANVSREQIADLPLRSRDFTGLIATQAGTAFVQEIEGSRTSGFGARISVAGSRPSSNLFVLDGTEVQTAHGQLASGVTGAALGTESVREFEVQTSSYSAKNGRTSGATIRAVTRSGTNDLHGSAYWYYRDDKLNARNFFDSRKPEFSYNQYGGSAGGPIVKNRTFYFANYEALRERLPERGVAQVPNAAARQGILPNPNRTVTVHPDVRRYLDLYPMPNTGLDFGDGTAEYRRTWNRPTDQDYVTARIDHNLGTGNLLFGRYTWEASEQRNENIFELEQDITKTTNHFVTLEYQTLFGPKFVNQSRASYTRNVPHNFTSPLAKAPTFSSYVGRPMGSIGVTGLTPSLSYGGDPRHDLVNTVQLADDATWEGGKNSISFGGAMTWVQYNKLQYSRSGGDWSFSSIDDFLQARPSGLRMMGFGADPNRTVDHRMVALYVQDDIQIHPRVVINAGVRYQYVTAPKERHGRLSNLRSWDAREYSIGEPWYQNPGGFFAPRLGLAWDVNGDGKTSVRTGVGLFHEPMLMRFYINAIDRIPPFWSDINPHPSRLQGLFPDLNPHLQRLSAEAEQALHVFQFDPDNSYLAKWSLSVQRMLATDLVAEVGYNGSRGIHLPARRGLGVARPQFVNGETFYPATETVLFNTCCARIEYYDTSADSWYHAMQATLTKRAGAGLHFQANYTWAQSLDTRSSSLGGEYAGSSYMDPFNTRRDKSRSDFSLAHVFTGNASYMLPSGTNLHGVAKGLLGGWQVSGIFTAQTGRPFSVSSNGMLTHPLADTGRPDLIRGGNTNPILGGIARYFDPSQFVPQRRGYYGNLGRNTLTGPGRVMLDASLMKNVQIAENKTVQFRVEAFNIMNHANFSLPATSLFNARGVLSGNAGRISSTATRARELQLALRFEF